MLIDSTTSARHRSLDDSEATTSPRTSASPARSDRVAKEPDWDRIPETSLGTLPIAAERDASGMKAKVERLVRDVSELRIVLGPYAEHTAHLHHAIDEIKEAVEVVEQTAHHPWLAPFAARAIHRAITHGIPEAKHAFDGMRKTAPEAAAKAKPILERIVRDVQDIQASLGRPGPVPAPLARTTHVRG